MQPLRENVHRNLKPPVCNLILIGLRGCGKSTLGKILAPRIGMVFFDLDRQVEDFSSMPITEIFKQQGEQSFRQLESDALVRLRRQTEMLLATGAGVICNPQNRRLLQELGLVVWLRVSPEESVHRLADDASRPPLTVLAPLDEAFEIAAQRNDLYAQTADWVVDTDGRTLEEVCNELQQLWHTVSGNHIR